MRKYFKFIIKLRMKDFFFAIFGISILLHFIRTVKFTENKIVNIEQTYHSVAFLWKNKCLTWTLYALSKSKFTEIESQIFISFWVCLFFTAEYLLSHLTAIEYTKQRYLISNYAQLIRINGLERTKLASIMYQQWRHCI